MTKDEKTHNAYTFRWKNFRGFEDTGSIRIRPVTILLGANNAGKSNLIAPLLLMNQTLASRESPAALLSQGPLFDGGPDSHLFTNCDPRKEMSFSFRYHMHEPKGKLSEVGRYPPGHFEVTFGLDTKKSPLGELFVKRQIVSDIYGRRFFEVSKKASGYTISTELGRFSKAEKELILTAEPTNFVFTSQAFLSPRSRVLKESERMKAMNFSEAFSSLLQSTSYNFGKLLGILGELSFLGPLRNEPLRFYPVTHDSPFSVGYKGEKLADVLNAALPKIRHPLNRWVKSFGFGDRLVFRRLSRESEVFEIGFHEKARNRTTNIVDAGFGASQLLPLLVQSLVSPPATLTIAEQPEIHLNPRLQVILASVFAHMAKRRQLVIVETHSEHLFLALRRLVGTGELKAEDLAIYFVEKREGHSHVREIEIKANGSLKKEDWPQGFFGEALQQSLDLAQLQFAKRKRT